MAMRVVLVKGVLRSARVLRACFGQFVTKKSVQTIVRGQFLSICSQKQNQKSSQNYRSSQNTLVHLKQFRLKVVQQPKREARPSHKRNSDEVVYRLILTVARIDR